MQAASASSTAVPGRRSSGVPSVSRQGAPARSRAAAALRGCAQPARPQAWAEPAAARFLLDNGAYVVQGTWDSVRFLPAAVDPARPCLHLLQPQPGTPEAGFVESCLAGDAAAAVAMLPAHRFTSSNRSELVFGSGRRRLDVPAMPNLTRLHPDQCMGDDLVQGILAVYEPAGAVCRTVLEDSFLWAVMPTINRPDRRLYCKRQHLGGQQPNCVVVPLSNDTYHWRVASYYPDLDTYFVFDSLVPSSGQQQPHLCSLINERHQCIRRLLAQDGDGAPDPSVLPTIVLLPATLVGRQALQEVDMNVRHDAPTAAEQGAGATLQALQEVDMNVEDTAELALQNIAPAPKRRRLGLSGAAKTVPAGGAAKAVPAGGAPAAGGPAAGGRARRATKKKK